MLYISVHWEFSLVTQAQDNHPGSVPAHDTEHLPVHKEQEDRRPVLVREYPLRIRHDLAAHCPPTLGGCVGIVARSLVEWVELRPALLELEQKADVRPVRSAIPDQLPVAVWDERSVDLVLVNVSDVGLVLGQVKKVAEAQVVLAVDFGLCTTPEDKLAHFVVVDATNDTL